MGRLGQKHAVAIAEKAVFLLDGVAIGGEDWFVSREGRDEHEQAGLGQVEVGEQGVDEAELEAGGDEDFRFAGMGLERTAVVPTATMRRPSAAARLTASAVEAERE